MRKSMTGLLGFVAALAFAGAAQAGDATTDKAAAGYDGCGYGQAYLQAQIDEAEAAEKAAVKAKIEALVDEALQTSETAAAPAATPVPNSGG